MVLPRIAWQAFRIGVDSNQRKENKMNFDPIFGEDNEIIGYVDNVGQEWTVQEAEDYFTITGNRP